MVFPERGSEFCSRTVMPMSNDSQVSTTTVRTRSLPPAPAGIVRVILLPFTHRPSNNFDPRLSMTASGSGFGVDAETGADERRGTAGLVADSFRRCREPTAVSGKRTYQKPTTGSKIWTMFGAAGKSVFGFVGANVSYRILPAELR